jgi:hypothetical protein
LKHDLDGARNLKLLLYMFELMAGLKINFNKSEVMVLNDEDNWVEVYAGIFNCQIGSFPIKYLGVPLSPSRLHVIDWLPLEEKSKKRLAIWKCHVGEDYSRRRRARDVRRAAEREGARMDAERAVIAGTAHATEDEAFNAGG